MSAQVGKLDLSNFNELNVRKCASHPHRGTCADLSSAQVTKKELAQNHLRRDAKEDDGMATTRKQTTTRINGKRVRLVTANGVTKVTDAPIEEWRLQAEAVRALRAMLEFAETAEDATAASFTLAADFNAGKRDAVKAKATGVTAGEADIRIYAAAGRLLLIEYKNAEGVVSKDQKARHALLRALGYRVEVVKAATPEECAAASVALVRGWLAANDNEKENAQSTEKIA